MRASGAPHPGQAQRLNKGITVDQVRAAAAATRRVGLGLSIYLITGIESEADEDLESTVRLIEEIRPHDGLVSPMTIYPGTALHEEARARHGLTEDYWVKERREAFYVREDPWTRRSIRTLLAALRRVGRRAAYGPEDFALQRDVVGDCYALRLSAGEFWQRRGALARAREQYQAILEDNPRSLWARMRLGALAMRQGRHAEAAEHYRAARSVAPAFTLARRLLATALAASRARSGASSPGAPARSVSPPA